MFGFELATVPVGGSIGLLFDNRWLIEGKRESKRKRQKLERAKRREKREDFGLYYFIV